MSARESLNRGELPAQQMLQGLMVALGGGLLVLPVLSATSPVCCCCSRRFRHFLVNRLRKRAEEQAMRQRAFAEEFEAAHRPGTHQPVGRDPM